MSTLVDQARAEAAWIGGIFVSEQVHAAKGMQIASLLRQLADRVQEMDGNEKFPDVLFDGYAVLQALGEKAKARTSAENVSDVLDAVVRLIRSSPPSSVQPEKEEHQPCQGANCGKTRYDETHSDECLIETAASQGWGVSREYLTVVFKGLSDEEVQAFFVHDKSVAFSWAHVIRELKDAGISPSPSMVGREGEQG